jgi:DNA replication and repair protein RecF
MSLQLKELELTHFRSHHKLKIVEPSQFIIITGSNASGKTNIVEALQLVSMLESFRHPQWKNVVTEGESEGSVRLAFIQNERELTIEMRVQEGRREYFLHDKKRAVNELKGLIPTVLFVPDDLSLIKGPAEARRRLIDDLGQQLSKTYMRILTDYERVVRQRNVILKDQKEQGRAEFAQESWDEKLIQLGALLFTHRIRLYLRLMQKTREDYQKLTNETLATCYLPSFNNKEAQCTEDELSRLSKEDVETRLSERLAYVREDEFTRAITLVGPHRDEIQFFINDKNAREFGSQGQQRSIALSLKLAELELIEEISGNKPLLLLDDVMSELDEKRREALLQVISDGKTTVVTTTDLKCFNTATIKKAQIIHLGA